MALTSCPECRGQVSTTAHSCPHCGHQPHGAPSQHQHAPVPRMHLATYRAGPPRSSGQSTLVSFLIGGVVVFGIAAVALVKACSTDVITKEEMTQQGGKAPPNLPVHRDDDAEADDALRILRAYYPVGRKVRRAHSKWNACMEETQGYAAFLNCVEAMAAIAGAAERKLSTMPHGQGECGLEIEQAHRREIEATAKQHRDWLAWTQAHRSELRRRMRTKSLLAGCSLDSGEPPCEGRPRANVDPVVLVVECTKRLFQCGLPDNVCSINKVADRLGITDAPKTGLRVRSTRRALGWSTD